MTTRRQGVMTAFVKSVDAEQGRVEVEYRSIDEQLASGWAPIAAPMSGGSRGALFMPEPGDEALVAFHDGRFDSPYVVGFLWNGKQSSPEKNRDNRVIVTPGGHQLRFEDKSGQRRVVLKSDGGRTITLDDQGTAIKIESTKSKVTLDDTLGKISIEAGDAGLVSITLESTPPTVTVTTGTGTVSIGPSGVTVTAPGTLTINAPGITNLTTGMLSVNAPIATFAGAVQCTALITNAVVSPLYSPGLGNLL